VGGDLCKKEANGAFFIHTRPKVTEKGRCMKHAKAFSHLKGGIVK